MQNLAAPNSLGERGPASISLLDSALGYARRGWRVRPLHTLRRDGCTRGSVCCARGKHPRLTNGSKGGSTDESVLRGWWAY